MTAMHFPLRHFDSRSCTSVEEELSTVCRATADALEILSKFSAWFYEKCYASDKFSGSLCQSSSQSSFKLNSRLWSNVLSLMPDKLAIFTQEICSSRKNSICSLSMTMTGFPAVISLVQCRTSERIWDRCFNGISFLILCHYTKNKAYFCQKASIIVSKSRRTESSLCNSNCKVKIASFRRKFASSKYSTEIYCAFKFWILINGHFAFEIAEKVHRSHVITCCILIRLKIKNRIRNIK